VELSNPASQYPRGKQTEITEGNSIPHHSYPASHPRGKQAEIMEGNSSPHHSYMVVSPNSKNNN
jgi:hypothetical protein